MGSLLTEVVIDAREPAVLARWWAEVLGWEVTDDEHGYSWISLAGATPPDALAIVFVPVPEPKAQKNRVHLDVNPTGMDQDAELARLLALGAARRDVGQGDVPWVVLEDPEGNEFCLLRRRADLP
jgi:hypothetical protein